MCPSHVVRWRFTTSRLCTDCTTQVFGRKSSSSCPCSYHHITYATVARYMSTNWNPLQRVIFVIELNFHNVAFSFTLSSNLSKADAFVGQASDNFIEYWTQVVSDKQINVYTMHAATVTTLIIKITISSLVIGLKKSYFPLIRLPSCYRTVCYWKYGLLTKCEVKVPGY